MLEGREEVVGMAPLTVFYAKVVHDEYEDEGAPGVAPESWGSSALLVAMFVQSGSEEVVC